MHIYFKYGVTVEEFRNGSWRLTTNMSKYEYDHLYNKENTLALFHGLSIKVSATILCHGRNVISMDVETKHWR